MGKQESHKQYTTAKILYSVWWSDTQRRKTCISHCYDPFGGANALRSPIVNCLMIRMELLRRVTRNGVQILFIKLSLKFCFFSWDCMSYRTMLIASSLLVHGIHGLGKTAGLCGCFAHRPSLETSTTSVPSRICPQASEERCYLSVWSRAISRDSSCFGCVRRESRISYALSGRRLCSKWRLYCRS